MLEDTDSHAFVNKELYYQELQKFYEAHEKGIKKPWTLRKVEEINKILQSSREAKEKGEKRTNEQHYFSRIYETMKIVPYEKFYEKLVETHISNGHGGRDKMLKLLKPKYSIPRPAVEIFVKCCTTCSEKKQQPKKGILVKPILPIGWNHRGQIDLIDFQSTPDGDYKYLLNYQDYLTKFVHLRPLKSKRVEEVASEILKIFLQFGAPQILQSNNGREFVNAVIEQLSSRWHSCKIVNGRPRHPQFQGSVERSNQDVENMLRAWLNDNHSTNWSLGCYYVQWQKNSSYNGIIKRTPYKALFGVDFSLGLLSSNLPKEIAKKITTEEDLEKVMSKTILEENITEVKAEENENVSEEHFVITKTEEYDMKDISIVEPVSCVKCTKPILHDLTLLMEANGIAKCELCRNEEIIQTQRTGCVSGQKRAAENFFETTNQKLKPSKFDRGTDVR
ncbi:KRAB-A domain-containing protein 2-like isoform X2 [Tribolium madens]|uniref:KRAB-A domain-containing protein 2-like isoform X2 n=1 Tax=Tribolium madens TaxID=41895 RepID=UPI001CF73B3A|nr:KRAB-A domain-containing protein 2-like isoform X2 [Tribolium madens]